MSTVRKKKAKKSKRKQEVSFAVEVQEKKTETLDYEYPIRRRSSSIAATANYFAAKHLSGKRASVPFLHKKKEDEADAAKRVSSAQVQLVSNAFKHIVQSKEAGALNLASTSKALFEYSKSVSIIDTTSYYLQLLKTSAETLLNIEQLDSSFSRNLQRKGVLPIDNNPSMYTSDPFEFLSLVSETLSVWNSYFRLARHSFNNVTEELITARSYNANLDGSLASNYSEQYVIGEQVHVPFEKIAFCGYVQIRSDTKVTEWIKVWIVVIWRHLFCFSSRDDFTLQDHFVLEGALVQRVGYEECQLNLILPARSLSILVESAKAAESLQIILDSCIIRCPGDISKLVFTTKRAEFILVNPKTSRKKRSNIPVSLESFLSLGDHEEPWRLLASGDESLIDYLLTFLIAWLSKPRRLKQLIDYAFCITTNTKKRKRKRRTSRGPSDGEPAKMLRKTTYQDSQKAFTLLAENSRKQSYYAQQASAVLANVHVVKTMGCHTKVIRHAFKILRRPSPQQIQQFVNIATGLISYHPDALFFYLITYQDSIQNLVALISNVSILKVLLSLWNCTANNFVQLSALDQIGREVLVQLLQCEYSYASEQLGHMLVYLEVLIRRLHAEKIQTARGGMKKQRWNPIIFDFNRDRLRHIKADMEQALQLSEPSPRNNTEDNGGDDSDIKSLISNHGRLDGNLLLVLKRSPLSDEASSFVEKETPSDFFLFLNETNTATALVKKALGALHIQTRVKTIQLLTTLVRHTQKRVHNVNDIPFFIQIIVNSAPQFESELRALPDRPVGFYRLAIVQLFRWVLSIRNVDFVKRLVREPLVHLIVNYMFIYPDHVFLTGEILGVVSSLCHNPTNICSSVFNDEFFGKLARIAGESVSLPCVHQICQAIFSQKKRIPRSDWEDFAEKWEISEAPRVASRFTRTTQLTEHWDDFHFLFSSF